MLARPWSASPAPIWPLAGATARLPFARRTMSPAVVAPCAEQGLRLDLLPEVLRRSSALDSSVFRSAVAGFRRSDRMAAPRRSVKRKIESANKLLGMNHERPLPSRPFLLTLTLAACVFAALAAARRRTRGLAMPRAAAT